MIRHRPADDPAAVQIHDGGQIEPALIGLDVGDIGEPDPVRRSGGGGALGQARRGREGPTAIGRPPPATPSPDRPATLLAPQPLHSATPSPPAPRPSLPLGSP